MRLAPRPAVLAGREALLADIGVRLALGPVRPAPRVAVLCGLPGAGKTSVAVEYAHRLLELGGAGVCWQFAAEDPAVLAAQFAVLAAQLGARDLADVRDPVAAVHAVLARAGTGWLVVFDNVPDLAAVEAFLPPAGPGRVLVTSQSQHWPPGWTAQVPVLDPAVAAQFLIARTEDTDHGAALELAKELGGLPLALEQAAAYMQAAGIPLARYLPLFRARQADLLARGEAAGHREHTAATLGLALSRLGREAPAAAGLMRLLAFLAPEPVPLGLLFAGQDTAERQGAETAAAIGPLLDDPVAAGDAVAALRRYSLAAQAGDGLVQVHRLVQAITRAQLTARQAGQWEQAAAAVVEAAVPVTPAHARDGCPPRPRRTRTPGATSPRSLRGRIHRPASWRPGCAGTGARSCGRAGVRAGSAAASRSAAPLRHPRGCPGRAARPGSACTPARILPCHLLDQHSDLGVNWRASSPAGIGPVPADQPPVPAQQRARRHQPAHPQGPGKQPGQGGEHRPVCPVQPRPRVLAAQHCDLLPQHQRLGILLRRRPRQQRQQPGQANEHQVEHPYRHKLAILPAKQAS